MKILLALLIFSTSLFAQFTYNDFNLAKTTFDRSFDKTIVNQYLDSYNDDSVKAALLSISHSNDQTWIEQIIKKDYDKYGNYIAFALGQLGESTISTKFLFDKINTQSPNKYLKECYEAFGNTADSASILNLFNIINYNKNGNINGLPYALNNFNSRYPLPRKEDFLNYIISEINHSNELNRKFDALFVLYRLGGSETALESLIDILNSDEPNINSLKYYALGSLRRISKFPNDLILFNNLINDPDFRIRTEAARTLCFYEFKDFETIKSYLSLLSDNNPNVSRQAAISVGNIKLEDNLKERLYTQIISYISDSTLSENTRGELFINYCNFKSNNYLELIDKFDSKISSDFIFRILSSNLAFPEQNFNYIKGNITDTTETDFLNIVQAIIPLQDSLSSNLEFNKFILSILNSSSKIGISLTAENLDSLIIHNNLNALQQIILEQVFKYLNDADYGESLKSLYNLSKRISSEFSDEVLQIYKTSKSNWLKTFAKTALGEKFSIEESKDISFYKLWEFAFKFTKAKVNTDKGSFIIEFTPEAAPISVGNFCYLSTQNYYSGCSFHRVVPNFVIQTGDPSGTGWGGPGYEIVSEFSLQPFNEMYVGMASSGKDTEGSQWFVMHSNFPHLDWRYTNYGKVIEGQNIVSLIDQKDKIINIELLK